MKRMLYSLFFITIFITISVLLLSACGSEQTADEKDWELTTYEAVNTLDGVTMNVKEETVSATGLTVTFENNTDKQCIYSEDFLLEKKIDGKWYQVPVILDNYGFNEPGYEINPSSEWTVDWEWLYGSLDSGEYRIVKSVLGFRGTGDYDEHHLTAEFTID
ncbi:immunoglobulin-like domain-containing protein [Ornithinibacillus californiensis]|uniref:immunoglobulin-like domain-containing protein n=1 Tax=Ornithinibacillus californiensis TaxID=161536 RepID=UPI00064DC4CA|nr:immunoglobulin-like domain-containing protein [Ornithinibacillus californiensis]